MDNAALVGDSPYLVKYIGWHTDSDGKQYVFAEWAEHGALDELLMHAEQRDVTQRRSVPLPHKIVMLQQIVCAMEELASHDVAHCDLAARNVLVMAYDANAPTHTRVQVSDYGLLQRCGAGPESSSAQPRVKGEG